MMGTVPKLAPTGMTWSGFRPSDDACQYGYLVPSNMFAVVVLEYIEDIFTNILSEEALVKEARRIRGLQISNKALMISPIHKIKMGKKIHLRSGWSRKYIDHG